MVPKVIASTDQPITFPMDNLTPWSYTQGIKDFFSLQHRNNQGYDEQSRQLLVYGAHFGCSCSRINVANLVSFSQKLRQP